MVAGTGPTLHERDAELALIDGVLAAASRGTGHMVLFEGIPGLGKSALLAEAGRRAAELEMKPLTIAARDKERPIPHSVSIRLLEPLLAELSAQERDEVFVGAAVLARPLFEPSQTDDDDTSDHGLARLHGLFWLCANLAERVPLFLAIDDTHWSDAASVRFLAHLLPRLEALPIAVAITARPDAVQHVGAAFQQLRSHPAMHVAKLAPLSKAKCEEIFAAAADGELTPERRERYCRIVQGNPFLLEQVLAAHREGGPEEVERIIEQATGQGIALAMTRRKLSGATDAEQRFARMVAALGPAANVARCADLAGLTRSEAQGALEKLVTAGVLLDSQPIGFTHPLIASAVLDSLPSQELQEVHRRAALMLHGEGASTELVASFLLLCDPVGETWAADAMKEAARRANAMGAQDSAAQHLRRLLEEDISGPDRGRALMDLGRAEALIDSERAVSHLRESLDHFKEAAIRAEVYELIGHQLYSLGRYEESTEVFEEAIKELGDSEPDLALKLRVDRVGVARWVLSKREEALREIEELGAGPPPASEKTSRQLYTEIALTHVREGESCEAAADALRHALPEDLDAPLGPAAVDWLLPAQLHCLAWTDQLEVGADLRNAALAEARRKGSLMLFATVGGFGGLGAYQDGSVSECAALAQQAIDAIPDGWALGIPIACTIAAYAFMERGELNEAERVIDLAFSDERTESSLQLAFLLEARARLALMWGTPESAIDDLDRAGRLATEVIRTNNPAVLGWRSRLARALDAIGKRGEALDLVDEEIGYAQRYGANRPVASAFRTKGFILGADGVEYLEEALSLIQGSQARLEMAGCQVSLGRSLRLAGDVRRARNILNEGLRGAVVCGSAMLENVARAELASAGARPRRRAVTGVAALTPGERRVVELAAEGRSNQEIAEALFITVKGVEWHLSNAYRKLGVATRSGLKGLDLTPGAG